MFDVGRVCMKLAGRDAGKLCVIIDVLDTNFVLIDGETRRRKCNISHLEPLEKTISVEKGASHDDVTSAFAEIGEARSSKPRKAGPKPKRTRKSPADKAAANAADAKGKKPKKDKPSAPAAAKPKKAPATTTTLTDKEKVKPAKKEQPQTPYQKEKEVREALSGDE